MSLNGNISAIGLPCLITRIISPSSTAENSADASFLNSVNVTLLMILSANVHCVHYRTLVAGLGVAALFSKSEQRRQFIKRADFMLRRCCFVVAGIEKNSVADIGSDGSINIPFAIADHP